MSSAASGCVRMAATSAGKGVVERPAKERDQSSDVLEDEEEGVGSGSMRPVCWGFEMGRVVGLGVGGVEVDGMGFAVAVV
jgi:hypothetical protein